MNDYDVPYECACCGNKSTNYLCGKCMAMKRDLENETLRSRLSRAEAVVEAARAFAHDDLCKQLTGNCEGNSSPIFQRGRAMIRLGDCRDVRASLHDYDAAKARDAGKEG